MVGAGEEVAADSAYGSAGDHILGMMRAGLHPAIGDHGGQRVRGHTIGPAVPLPQKFRGGEGNRGVCRGKLLPTAMWASLFHGIFEGVGGPHRQGSGLAKLPGPLGILGQEDQSGGGRR